MQQMIFIADLIVCSTYFGEHYAHLHVVAACGFGALVFKLSV